MFSFNHLILWFWEIPLGTVCVCVHKEFCFMCEWELIAPESLSFLLINRLLIVESFHSAFFGLWSWLPSHTFTINSFCLLEMFQPSAILNRACGNLDVSVSTIREWRILQWRVILKQLNYKLERSIKDKLKNCLILVFMDTCLLICGL